MRGVPVSKSSSRIAVAADAEVRIADEPRTIGRQLHRPLVTSHDQIVVAESLPLLESHPLEPTESGPRVPLPDARDRRRERPALGRAASPTSSSRSVGESCAARSSWAARERAGCVRPGRAGQLGSAVIRSPGAQGQHLAHADDLGGGSGQARGVEGSLDLGHQPVVQLTLHTLGDECVEGRPWTGDADDAGGLPGRCRSRVGHRAGRDAPTRASSRARLTRRGLRRSIRARRSRARVAQLVDRAGQVGGDELLDRLANAQRRLAGEVQLGDRCPKVQAGSACDDRAPVRAPGCRRWWRGRAAA